MTATYQIEIKDVEQAALRLKNVVVNTPLMKNLNISKRLSANVFLKREDLQLVRSYKIRGAYNKISSLSEEELKNGVVCASAGNHAQGVAYSCNQLKIQGTIFMPAPTPKQKVEQVKMFGEDFVEVVLQGDTFDDSQHIAADFCKTNHAAFIHPFDDEKVIEGQATIGLEILNQTSEDIDYLFLPIGGGGLAAGVASVFKKLSPNTKIIGVEPHGAPSMSVSIQNKQLTKLNKIDKFVDGAAVKQVGEITYNICKDVLDDVVTVDEGKVCDTILKLYNRDAIVVEPAGALTISALDQFADKIKGKNVVCLVSGSNNDITRMEDIKERAMLYNGLKHYFLVGFPQRAGALKEFVAEVLGPTDDISYFEYTKKTSREKGFAVVGIELKNQEDFEPLLQRMKDRHFFGDYLNDNEVLLDILI